MSDLDQLKAIESVALDIRSREARRELTTLDRDRAEQYLLQYGLTLGHLPTDVIAMLKAARPSIGPQEVASRRPWVVRLVVFAAWVAMAGVTYLIARLMGYAW